MAAVGQPMDDSYAERARKAAAAPKSRNNIKSVVSQTIPEPVGIPSSSTSETLDSSPALSAAQTTTTSLALPPSIPISSASSDRASPVRTSPRNAWSERGSQKALPTTTIVAPNANSDYLLIKADATRRVHPDDNGYSPTKLSQTPSTRTKNDPFVVKYNKVPPNLADAEIWPQIGEASTTSSSPRHARPPASSVSSLTMVSGSQTPANPASESEGDQSGAKRKGKSLDFHSSKRALTPIVVAGERTKWVAIPAKELQAAVDEVERRRTPSLKGHSPHLNGRGRRAGDYVQNQRGVRDSGPSIIPSVTRHDRNPSLGVPSSSSSRRVSPLHLTASLPSPSSNFTPEHPHLMSATSLYHVTVPLDHHASVEHSGSGPGNQYSSSSSIRYSPWQTPSFTPYHSNIQANQIHSRSPAKGGNGPQQRQRRRRRPTPREAPPLAGFRANMVVILRSEEYPPIVPSGAGQELALDDSPRPLLSSRNRNSTRSPWWSNGVSPEQIERWHRQNSRLQIPMLTGHDLGSVTAHKFFSNDEVSSMPEETSLAVNPTDSSRAPNGSTPGSGPSGLDIDIAMRTPVLSTYDQPGNDTYVHHMPSPSRANHRVDWAPRDDGSSISNTQPAYSSIHPSPISTENPAFLRPSYGGGDDKGRGRWRGDDRGPRGRGRGFPSRGRGFRGMGNPRAFNPPFGHSPGQPPYPGGQFTHTAPLYIPEPALQPSFYPYPSPVAPPLFAPYLAGPMPVESGSISLGKPPSPRPLTRLTFHMEDTRFKLLGQIEYYFSHDNVAKDVYLRERMDSKGWVPMQVLQSFPRIQSLRVSDDMIRETLQWSQFVEVRQSHVRMAHEDWRHYVLPAATESIVPEVSHHWYPQPVYSPYMGGIPPPFYGYTSPSFPYYQPVQPEESHAFSNGVADHILRKPEERVVGNGAQESGTSGGNSIHSTPNNADGEELETSEDDVEFVIGDPSPMIRPSTGPADPKWS